MSKGIITDYWGYGCAVLRNARRNIEKHNQVIRKHVLGKINLAYRAHLISEAEYLRTLKTLKKDYRLV